LKIIEKDEAKRCSIVFHNYPSGASILTYNDGKKYEGELKVRTFEPNGKGIATFIDGSSYEGTWKEGLMDGKGKFTWNDGS
jgi:hypothetical protein